MGEAIERQVSRAAIGRASPIPFLEFRPSSGRLVPHVAAFYLYLNEVAVIRGTERVDLGQWRFILRGSGEVTFPDGRTDPTFPVMVNGPGTAHWRYRMSGPMRCFGISLRGIGWRSLIGISADRIADRIIDAQEIFGDSVMRLHAQLQTMDTLDEMVAAIEPLMIERLDRARRVPRAHVIFLRIVREWSASDELTLDALYSAMAAETGMGQRQVQRLCKEYFAGPPNHLRRKFRAIGAAVRIYHGASLNEVMGPFADQSHLINELKHFTGHTPGSLREGIDPVLAATLEDENLHFLPDVIPEMVDLDDR
ncbi:AraC family transcriptional regulator [Sphingomonas sp. RS6]